MTGRGIDQILPHPCPPHLYEPYVRSALDYVALAESVGGPLPRQASFEYVWGDALSVLRHMQPDARIVNLETAVTVSEDAWPGKGIHYRMHPANLPCLTVAGVDCCALANNHVLDWGYRGLEETLASVRAIGIQTAGSGRDADDASVPAAIGLATSRVQVFAFAAEDSGVPDSWAVRVNRPGVNMLGDLSPRTADAIARRVQRTKRARDVALVSLHWGSNWGYKAPSDHRAFAHRLIDAGGIDVVHGHSSHHPKGIEIYRERPILYGCGDFLNDYEGISGHEAYRPQLTLMYLVTLDSATGALRRLVLVPMHIRRFRLNHASRVDATWLLGVIDRECRKLGSRVEPDAEEGFRVVWT